MARPPDTQSFLSGPNSGMSLRLAVRALSQEFKTAGIDFAQEDAREIIMAVTDLNYSQLITSGLESLTPEAFNAMRAFALRRMDGEPIDHILGWREFYGRRFAVNSDVLSPRADTETLISLALGALRHSAAPNILDLGTGSGAILITLLAERPKAVGVGVDISEAALTTARANAKTLAVETRASWEQGDWFAPLNPDMRFDAIMSNPPYIKTAAMKTLETEVKDYDPHIALSGGADGLSAYRHIIARAKNWLLPRGWLGFEIGFDQSAAICALLEQAGFVQIQSHRDLGGNPRVICAITNS